MSSITVKNVTKSYKKITALTDVSLEIQDGEFFCILGPPGAGKTTLLRSIVGLEKVNKGEIIIGGEVVNNIHPSQRDIAMIFQNLALYPDKTVFENIAFPLQQQDVPEDEIKERVEKVAKQLKIDWLLEKIPSKLSGGERQRVAIGRAIVRQPKAYLMDEPLSNLDALLRLEMRVSLKELQTTLKETFVYVTHDQVEAVALADRVIVMDHGVIQQIVTPLDLYLEPANLFVAGFIGEPPMNLVQTQLSIEDGELALKLSESEQTIMFQDNHINSNWIKKLERYDSKNLVIGIRPQRLQLAKPDQTKKPGKFAGELVVHEFLGNYGIAQVEVGQIVLESVTSPEIPQKAGDKVELLVNFDDINFFDPETTNRIS